MKYVALISGGKDSCFNLLHCHKQGHELIAAATLSPAEGKEELDSYLYQTVGQDAIQLVAQALEVPLYRRIIVGSPIEQGSEYGERAGGPRIGVQGDETEDLVSVLADVKAHHPDVQGVSVGAILSNYQRVRVEHVCNRLGLTPLCYLWQRDQSELFSEMVRANMEAILIKVAGIGLTPKHLGKSLTQMQDTLMKLNALYGSHICGEGGEYETFTLDCPLFKSRIILEEVESVIHSDSGFATVAFLRIKKASLQRKDSSPPNVVAPPVLDDSFEEVYSAIETSRAKPSTRNAEITPENQFQETNSAYGRNGRWSCFANIFVENSSEMSVEEEVEACFSMLQGFLEEHALTLVNCINMNLFLASMDIFPRVNAVYQRFFGTSPPARACVAVDLPSNIRIKLDCLAYTHNTPSDRQALHVQALSYWAPANIGPYSQAILADDWVFISGQIGLVPSTLMLPSPTSLAMETALSFQHAKRVQTALSENTGNWTGYAQATIYWLSEADNIQHVKAADETARSKETGPRSPTLYVAVKALPRQGVVEKQVLMHTGQHTFIDEDDCMVTSSEPPVFVNGNHEDQGSFMTWELSQMCMGAFCVMIFGKGQVKDMRTLLPSDLFQPVISARLFYLAGSPQPLGQVLNQLSKVPHPLPTTTIPCRAISDQTVDGWEYALCLLGNNKMNQRI